MRILACLLAVLFIAGCGGEKTVSNGKILLNVWESYNNEEHELFQKLIKDYQDRNPGIEIKVSQIPWVGHEAKYRTSLTVEGAPDLGRIDTGFLAELVSNDAVLALDEFGVRELESEFVKAALYSNIYKGKIYGLPDQITGVCLFYNKDLFQKCGLDPAKPPQTWDQFLTAAKALTRPENNQYGFGMDNSLWWSFPFFNTFGAEFISEDGKTCLLNKEQAIKALQFKVDLYLKEKVEGGAWIPGAINPEVGFLNGRYAMIFMGPWNVKNFQKSGVNFGVAMIPAGSKGTSTNVGGSDMVIFKSCKYPKEAYSLLRYITGNEFQGKWASQLSQVPTNLKAFGTSEVQKDPILGTFMEQMKTAAPRPPLKGYGRIEEIINPEMEAALNGKKSVEDALNQAVEKINKEVMSAE
ncbi:MAG: extracellular solute-binding protein [Candidatus Wallbacteria bacterium]|nr:extracellular solute-binding protein [Candidatus Wallbacteria bacterium]